LRIAKELTFDERREEEAYEQEDGKKERKRVRGRREASEEVSETKKGRLSVNIADNMQDDGVQTKVFQG
jgi:hypothetical protein